MPPTALKPPKTLYAGLFFTTLSTLMLELVLTRIFSVILWYHFAFMSVSLALFGLSASGVFLYAFRGRFPEERAGKDLARLTLFFGMAVLTVGFLLLERKGLPSVTWKGMVNLSVIYILSSIPFFFGGLATSLVLTRYTASVSNLYFFDLLGAAAGCLLLIPFLDFFGGVQTLFAVAGLALAGSLCFAWEEDSAVRRNRIIALVILAGLWGVNSAAPFMKIRYVKGFPVTAFFDAPPVFQAWNSFSQVSVYHWNDEGNQGYTMTPTAPIMAYLDGALPGQKITNPNLRQPSDLERMRAFRKYTSWAKSDRYQGPYPQQLAMVIDGAAGTMISKFTGDREALRYQEYEITSLAYHLKQGQGPDVLIIGPGGGPDVLTALRYEAREVTGVELNPLIYHIVNDVVGDFTNHLYSTPPVSVVVDEGRSFIRRADHQWDIIQASLIDTWAATAAGAYTLSENTLYTVEAFRDYLRHLTPDGIFTMSRYHFTPPQQSLRMAALAVQAVEEEENGDAAAHLMIIKKDNIDTLLMKRSPFTEQEVASLEERVRFLGFEILYTPQTQGDPIFSKLITSKDREPIYASYPFDITPCYDDKPFFFNGIRLRDFAKVLALQLRPRKDIELGQSFNYDAVIILCTLFFVAAGLVALFIAVPLFVKARADLKGFRHLPRTILYFSCLGLGFMLVEIALLQKFVLFLGHPVYSLAVILFSLLLSSSIGSHLTGYLEEIPVYKRAVAACLGVAAVACVYTYLLLPLLFRFGIGWPIAVKILVTILLLLPLGMGMGMPFPLGLHIVNRVKHSLVPWIWGINGATSVLGSILAFLMAMGFGFTFTLLSGQVIYGVAALTVLGFGQESSKEG